MGSNHTIYKSQVEAATGILERMRALINPEFVGIISTRGLPVTVLSSSSRMDVDALASLAASSFAATSQLAMIASDSEYAVMFHEGDQLNVHISRISKLYLLVVCFRNTTDIGKVRIVTRRAHPALSAALGPAGGEDHAGGVSMNEASKALDELNIDGSRDDGTD